MRSSHHNPKRVLGSPFKSPIPTATGGPKVASSPLQGKSQSSFAVALTTTINEEASTNTASNTEHITNNGEANSDGTDATLQCPICQETMINNHQLNRHIDDVHGSAVEDTEDSSSFNTSSPKPVSGSTAGKSTAKSPKKILNLDLHENNRGFTFSEQLDSDTTSVSPSRPVFKNTISRSHWQQPSSTSANHCCFPSCGTVLNIRNGIVNCRKCGKLYCNKHTNFKCLLKNGDNGKVDYAFDRDGTWSRCCETCYFNKPDLKEGTQVNSINLFDTFKASRQKSLDVKQLQRNKIQSRFIKLTNYLVKEKFYTKNDIWSFINSSNNSKSEIMEYWDDDKQTMNCSICYVKFNFLIRKHHCRLCGKIVCDDPAGERKNCSILVPLNILLEKLPNLNYSSLVDSNIQKIQDDSSILFRCCVNCKDDLLYEWKFANTSILSEDAKRLFELYDTIVSIKQQVARIMPKYRELVLSLTLNDMDIQKNIIQKLRHKLMICLKDLENQIKDFKSKYFVTNKQGKLLVIDGFASYASLLSNMYQSFLIFLQQNLIDYKALTNHYQDLEKQKLELQRASEEKIEVPRLTKKQIRELREQLMVMNEQKFLVENLINDYTKLRKFDELASLEDNKKELELNIIELESQLGDFGF